MKKSIFFILLCSLMFASCGNRENVCVESDLITDGSLPLMKVAVSPTDTVGFLIDTGSDFTVINESYYKANSQLFKCCGTVEHTVTTINGEQNYNSLKVSADFINGVKFQYYVMDINYMTQYLSGMSNLLIVGIIGSDFFGKTKSTLDFENNKLITKTYVKKSN